MSESLEIIINKLKNEMKIYKALLKLHSFNDLVNKLFKKLYKKEFNKTCYDFIPHVVEFINYPPNRKDKEYEFWERFKSDYSYEQKFCAIYNKINNDSPNDFIYADINNMSKFDFLDLIKSVYPDDYESNPKLYARYINWIFQISLSESLKNHM